MKDKETKPKKRGYGKKNIMLLEQFLKLNGNPKPNK